LSRTRCTTNAGIEAFLNSVAQTNRKRCCCLISGIRSARSSCRFSNVSGPYHPLSPVGANHQLPPEISGRHEGAVHSFDRKLEATRAWPAFGAHDDRMKQSRVLRVSGQATKITRATEPSFGTEIVFDPAGEFNDLFDATAITPELERIARQVRRRPQGQRSRGRSISRTPCSHATVLKIMDRHEGGRHHHRVLLSETRKPCLSFALNNGNLVPCGCENHLDATLSLMLGSACFWPGRISAQPGIRHRAESLFCLATAPARRDCTGRRLNPRLTTEAILPSNAEVSGAGRAMAGCDAVTLFKYHGGKNQAEAWRGKVIGSPTSPPTGGCATRTLVQLENVPDVCTVYPGPHPFSTAATSRATPRPSASSMRWR